MHSDIVLNLLKAHSGVLGSIILNRPQALNALNFNMLQAMTDFLNEQKQNKDCFAILIEGASEKAFCAGGDIKTVYQNGIENFEKSINFFKTEYNLNQLIYNYPKPYIAFIHGITMGGGLGVSHHGSHLVASTDLMLAMPETTIGFFPDIGASYFLSRLPNEYGTYLGLTSSSINYAEALTAGLIKNVILKKDFVNLKQDILDTDFKNKNLDDLIAKYKIKPDSNISNRLIKFKNIISKTFAKNSIEEIITSLENLPSQEFVNSTLNSLKQNSPNSLQATLKLLRKAKHLDFKDCMLMEAKLALQFLQHKDFYEGIRAKVIDKDNSPNWDLENHLAFNK